MATSEQPDILVLSGAMCISGNRDTADELARYHLKINEVPKAPREDFMDAAAAAQASNVELVTGIAELRIDDHLFTALYVPNVFSMIRVRGNPKPLDYPDRLSASMAFHALNGFTDR